MRECHYLAAVLAVQRIVSPSSPAVAAGRIAGTSLPGPLVAPGTPAPSAAAPERAASGTLEPSSAAAAASFAARTPDPRLIEERTSEAENATSRSESAIMLRHSQGASKKFPQTL